MNTQPPNEQHNAALAVLTHRVEAMHNDFGEMRGLLKDMTEAITKLALVEERQTQAAQAQDRTVRMLEKQETRIERVEGRVGELERAEPAQKQASKWVFAAVWGAAGLFGVLLLEIIKKRLLGM